MNKKKAMLRMDKHHTYKERLARVQDVLTYVIIEISLIIGKKMFIFN